MLVRTPSTYCAGCTCDFNNDATRYCEVQFMVSKGEASSKVREYLIYLERQLGHRTRTVRTDNGKEYVNNALTSWCKETGIDLQVTVPYSPAQNGVAERFNRTLGELARAMRLANDAPAFLWPKAVAHTAYVRNCSHMCALVGMTPYEHWTTHRPDVSHLQEFGCPVWIMKEGVSINKLAAKSEKFTFVGFLDGLRAVHFYDARTRSITTSHNFRFLKDSPNGMLGEGELRRNTDGAGNAPDTIDREQGDMDDAGNAVDRDPDQERTRVNK